MALSEQINADLTAAMKAREAGRVSALRMLKAALMNKGIAVVCPVRDAGCVRSLDNFTARRAPARRVEVELTPRWLGLSGAPDRFVISIIPPRGVMKLSPPSSSAPRVKSKAS